MPVALDLRPLQYSGFRRLFGGSLFAVLVSQGLVVVVANAVYDLTKSSFAVGLVAAAELVPLMLLALLGGAVADAFDRRLVVLTAESLQLVCLGLLALDLSLDRPHLWVVYVLAAVEAGTVARFTNTTTSVISGGLICVIGAVVLAVLLPRFRRYNSLDPAATLEPASVGFSAAG